MPPIHTIKVDEFNRLTPVQRLGEWWVKREDLAYWTGIDYPSGSKVRQYMRMAKATPGLPMLVGCSATSCMSVYVAAAAKQTKVPAIIYTAKRGTRTESILYALEMGAEIVEVSPGYLSLCRRRAKERSLTLGKVVRWDVAGALQDAFHQCANLPRDARRIVVPTGSGLIASGVLAGVAEQGLKATVVAIAVSPLATEAGIRANAAKLTSKSLPAIEVLRTPSAYDAHAIATLADGTPLDPYYAAKAMSYLRPDDVLWLPGLRPVRAMPLACRRAFSGWHGPHSAGTV